MAHRESTVPAALGPHSQPTVSGAFQGRYAAIHFSENSAGVRRIDFAIPWYGTRSRAALEHIEEIFVNERRRKDRADEVEKEALFEDIGRLKVELDWLKKAGLLG